MSSRIIPAQSSADAADSEEKQRELQDKAYAMELVNMSAVPMVLSTVIELDILEIIRRAGPNAKLSPAQIASQIPTNKNPQAPMMIDRMLSLLAAFNIVTCDEDATAADGRLYGVAPVAKYFVRNEDGVSLGPLLGLNQDKVFMDSWYKLKDAVLEGGSPFDMVHGKKDAFQYSKSDSRFH
ncbi:Plant methyltransferase dimerization [Dillenia turbinata]|uniref:Plant methyltransferase dimerization n=1 Tax=Dillenia turbinata TaxID=194707 RepID=A0AAN8WB09_9MAGN